MKVGSLATFTFRASIAVGISLYWLLGYSVSALYPFSGAHTLSPIQTKSYSDKVSAWWQSRSAPAQIWLIYFLICFLSDF